MSHRILLMSGNDESFYLRVGTELSQARGLLVCNLPHPLVLVLVPKLAEKDGDEQVQQDARQVS